MCRKFCNFKRITALLAAFALVLVCAPVAYAAEGTCGENLTWSLSGGTLTISGSGAMTEFTEQDMPPWYGIREQILSLSLSGSLTSIGSLAFYDCDNLSAVSIPGSVTAIGEMAFSNCDSLAMLTLKDGLKSIGEKAFEKCSQLQDLTIPGTVETISSQAFYFCESLACVTIPSSVWNMGAGVFSYCSSLVRADLGVSMYNLPSWTFYGCDQLTMVNVQGSAIGASALKIPTIPGSSGNGGSTYTPPSGGNSGSTYTPPSGGNSGSTYTPPSGGSGGSTYTPPSGGNSGSADTPPVSGNGSSQTTTVTGSDGSTVTTDITTSSDGSTTTTTTTTTNSDGSSSSTTNTVEKTENSTIITNSSTGSDAQAGTKTMNMEITATVLDAAGWDDVIAQVDTAEILMKTSRATGTIYVTVYSPNSNIVPKEALQALTGRSVMLNVRTQSGSQFSLDCEKLGQQKFRSDLDLSYTLEVTEDVPEMLSGCTVYRLSFHNSASILAEIIIRLPGGHVRQTASLYQIEKGDGLNLLQSVMVDDEGNAHWYLKSVDHKTEYLIGMNVPGANPSEAIIPEVLYDEYKVANVYDGVEYVVTGRSSSWNMGLGQVMGILAAVMVTVIVGVGVFMYMLNKRKLAMGYIPELDDEDFM